ncbi:hypothetical protein RHMOL_Rhmol09G0193100 [Rhododendron molle]|uniref:Uncharacterized protein n=2 Tax=Rhododendron molle TaxID=49168 RepID=A0ACC0MG80_RHOML|nr:hypothetical protein RHMOL_Rhmol09G0193100 [Rhododendron molle]
MQFTSPSAIPVPPLGSRRSRCLEKTDLFEPKAVGFLVHLFGMESATDLVEYNYEALASFTGGFCEENFIGDTLYGKVFRGKIQQGLKTQEVVVKIWVNCRRFATTPELQKSRLNNEIKLLTNSGLKGHPNLVKLIGFCCETERLGVVYELKLLDTLEKLILHDDFKWLARIKVALEFACLLECFHDQQLWHRSIGAAYLMIDQAFSPRLFDFPMLVGGGFGEIRSREYDLGSDGYIDPLIGLTGAWSDKTDVFAFGVVLLGLIAKRVYDVKKRKELGLLNYVHIWAWTECGKPQSKNFRVKEKPQSKLWGMFKKHKESQLILKSLVDKSLENDEHFDAGDGIEITKLAMRCVDEYPKQRPTMKEVVRCLRELDVVKKFSCFVLPKMSVASSGGVVPGLT